MERYESLGPVGEGSYGTVLKCRHRHTGRFVAIKKFIDLDDDETVKKIALREIKLLRQLRHDNLVNLLEVWKRRRRWYLVFEFVDRTLLDELQQCSNGLDLNTCRQYLFQILRAVNFCHQQDVIHRDIKPENILISQEGVVKLCDFGFARTVASPSEGGVYTDYVATRWYRAPELLVGDIKYGKPVDVWALGCLLIEMLTAQPLFPGDSDLDQIYHIVRCFGNLTAHHQELFYRNPVFSEVKLPECSKIAPLQQRFPKVPPTALDMAQKCLEMDPKIRAQCSDLIEHLLFTQDSFNIRFLDELNTKIHKDHRENSTLPKIPIATLPEKDKGDDKNCKNKGKKQSEETEEKVNKDKTEKTKGKQPSKLSKSIHTTNESFMTKQLKTFGNKDICHTEQIPVNPEKTSTSELKEFEILKSTKICLSDSSDVTKKAVNLKKKTSVATKPKIKADVSPDSSKDYIQKAKDIDHSDLDKEKTMKLLRESSNSETNEEFVRNSSLKVCKLSKTSSTDGGSLNLSPKTVLQSDTSVAPTYPLPTFNDFTTPTIVDVTKSGKTSLASKFQIEVLETNAKHDSSECPKAKLKSFRKSQTISTSGQNTHNTSFNHSRDAADLSKQSFTPVTESSAAHNLSALPRGISLPKTKTPSKDKEPTDDQDVRKYHRFLKLNPMTETPTILLAHDSDGEPDSSEHYFSSLQSNIIAAEEKVTSTLVPNENLPVENALTLSVQENQEDSAISASIDSTANILMNKTLMLPERSPTDKRNNNSQELKFDAKSFNIFHHNQNPAMSQLFGDHTRFTKQESKNPKNQKTAFTPDGRKKSNKLEGNSTNISSDFTSVTTVDHKALTRSLILHERDSTDTDGFNHSVARPSTPAPAANLLHLPPSSKTLTPSIFVSSANRSAACDHLQAGSFHTGTNNLWNLIKPICYGYGRQDQQFGLNQATRSFTLQAREKSFVSEKSKNIIHFPNVRTSVLPELSGKEAKQNKGATKEQRTEKTPVSLSPASEGQYGQNFNSNTPKQME